MTNEGWLPQWNCDTGRDKVTGGKESGLAGRKNGR